MSYNYVLINDLYNVIYGGTSRFLDDVSVNNIDKIIFNKRTTIIKWKNGEKTITKCLESDHYTKTKGFLIGYYQYTCKYLMGISKTRAMDYLNYIVSEQPTKHRRSYLDDAISKVIFNDPATILMWGDKKIVCKCSLLDSYDKETGFLMCFFKLFSGLSSGTKISNFLVDNIISPTPKEDPEKNIEPLVLKNAIENLKDKGTILLYNNVDFNNTENYNRPSISISYRPPRDRFWYYHHYI